MKLLRSIRLGPLAALAVFAALVALAVWAVSAVLRTIPQRTVVMAVYPEGSLNAELVKRYQEVLAGEGIKLRPAPSATLAPPLLWTKLVRMGTNFPTISGESPSF